MDDLTNDDFKRFIKHYKDRAYVDENHKIHKCYDKITELSRSDTRADPLIKNSEKMYGLDWMVKTSKRLSGKPPKSTDALYIHEDEEGNLDLHIIEFKFIGKKSQRDKMNILWHDIKRKICEGMDLNGDECFDGPFVRDFKSINKNFHDPIEVSLQLKPYEVIFITLPELYFEYCEEKDIPKKDIKAYLTKINKYYWAFVGNHSKDEYNIKGKINRYNRYNQRLERTIFKKARAKPWQRFNGTLKYEIYKENMD